MRFGDRRKEPGIFLLRTDPCKWECKPEDVDYHASMSGCTMSKSRKRPSRRNFLKTAAGVAASTVLIRKSLWAQSKPVSATATDHGNSAFPRINRQFMITPDQAWDWASFKSQGGPTYAG